MFLMQKLYMVADPATDDIIDVRNRVELGVKQSS